MTGIPTLAGNTNLGHGNPKIAAIRCPACSRNGAFPGLPNVQDVVWKKVEKESDGTDRVVQYEAGVRVCPNPACQAIVFVRKRSTSTGQTSSVFPAELREFDPTDLPDIVRACMEESIKCHAQECYRAAAIMVRRTLEAMCEERGAKGPSLEKRIEALKGQMVISEDLIQGAHELRFLGNDAAHVEAKAYNTVGKDEIEAAIDLAKELLRAAYQTAALVNRLRALKGTSGPAVPKG